MTYYELVDQVAKTLFYDRRSDGDLWDKAPHFVRMNYVGLAEKVMGLLHQVLREPTDEMIDAANRARPTLTSRTIQAAIDASPLKVTEDLDK
jgi:hypothetical protein